MIKVQIKSNNQLLNWNFQSISKIGNKVNDIFKYSKLEIQIIAYAQKIYKKNFQMNTFINSSNY